jgi:hypothetical protein
MEEEEGGGMLGLLVGKKGEGEEAVVGEDSSSEVESVVGMEEDSEVESVVGMEEDSDDDEEEQVVVEEQEQEKEQEQEEAESSSSSEEDSVDFSKLKVKELKSLLKTKGLNTAGKKAELVERLQAQ